MAKDKSKKFRDSDSYEVEEVVETSVVESKKERILKSKMPEAQKIAYMKSLGMIEDPKEDRVPLSVYFRVRKIEKSLWAAMQAYPAAAIVEWATLKCWDEIFKNF